ncbi:hypothetical protein ACFQ49_06040 [Kroppenstedtia eburnea]|uniref:hypothetical protein n=1 Tax=Kroppenstedtia eburnea TaxID=714067 RepID=UPI001F3AC446|nr:hypothetical protein [Kroppenstedtia eburnea]
MQGGVGFTWSDFGSSEQRKRHVKPNPDRPSQNQITTLLRSKQWIGFRKLQQAVERDLPGK